MLHILRHIRRSFFLPGKVRTYLAYAIGEIALIVVGILIAVQIGEWNQARKDYAEETAILLRLKSEIEKNKKSLEALTEIYRGVATDMRVFLEIMVPEPQSYPDDEIFSYLASLRGGQRFNEETGVVTSLINSGKIGLIRNDLLNRMLNSWLKSVANIDTMAESMAESMRSYSSDTEFFRRKDVGLGTHSFGSAAGSSHFPYDQKKLLSSPLMEDWAETKLEWTDLLLQNFERIIKQPDNILELIDRELAMRGIDEDN